MNNSIVVGAGFGDEGKGLVTSWLCSKPQHFMVVRFSGGPQAGHTVVQKNIKHTFSNFGSGTLQGVPTFWSKYCPFFPTSFMNELKALQGYGLKPKVYIDPRCPVTTPFEILKNREGYSLLNDNGSCGMGVGQTWQREEDHYKLCVQDLFYPQVLQEKLRGIGRYYNRWVYGHHIPQFGEACREVIKYISLDMDLCGHATFNKTDLIFEGSQGILLDQDHGFFPNVTRSNTVSKNALNIVDEIGDLQPSECIDIYYVTRSYQTRHGNGFMSGAPISVHAPGETNKYNDFQGDFRTSILDPELLAYAIKCDKLYHNKYYINYNLVITCMDQHPINIDQLLMQLASRTIMFQNVYLSYGPQITDIKLFSSTK